MTAYLPSSLRTGALGTSEIHKVRFPLWDFPIPEACFHTVIVLVALTGAAVLYTFRTASAFF